MRIRVTVLVCIICSLCVDIKAQTDIVFSAIDSRNGLSDNRIRNIAQLTDGRIMITTEGVSNIYDGTSFSQLHLQPKDISALPGYYGLHHSYVAGNYVWIKNYQRLMLVDINKETYIQNPDSVIGRMGIAGKAADLFLDSRKNYWIKTTNDQLYFYSPTYHRLRLFDRNISNPTGQKDELYDIAVVRDEVFLFYSNGLMLCYRLSTGKLLYTTNSLRPAEQPVYNRTLMVVQDGDVLYMLRNHKKGIMQAYNTRTRSWSTVLTTDYWLNTISIDKQGTIWVSCKAGLWKIDKSFRNQQLIRTFRLVDGTDVTTEASTLYNDTQGGFWIGTFNHGLLYYHPDRFKFRHLGKLFFSSQGEDIRIQSFSEPVSGLISIETNKGYYNYQCSTGQLRKGGSPATGSGQFRTAQLISKIHSSNNLVEWISKVVQMDANTLTGLCNAGVFSYNMQLNKLTFPLRQGTISNQYTDLIRDRRGWIWIGMRDGLLVWNPSTHTEKILYKEDGLINNSIKSLQEDTHGNIWITTAGGISRITVNKPENGQHFQVASFNHYDGVIENEFLERSIYLSKRGILFAGGINGMNIIDLNKPWQLQLLQKPLFTAFTLFGTEIKYTPSEKEKILRQTMAATDTIVLKYNQNHIGLSFSALNYVNPTQTYYQYRMEGVDDNWREIQATNGTGTATYTNLSPGIYTLEVKAANSSKQWSRQASKMTIIIQPPFWKTPVAYLIYLLCVAVGIYLLLDYYKRRTHRLLIQKNEEQLNQMKFNFFTNISHEFRTPLTLILTPLESVIRELEGATVVHKLQSIQRHAQELLSLVNELLDFRRLETGGEQLHLSLGDIVTAVGLCKERFEKLALEQNIDFRLHLAMPEVMMYFDGNKLNKVINNLLSNAFKFTPKGGVIEISLNQASEKVIIEIYDNGSGIAEKDIPHIFDRFYQADDHAHLGSGIGLQLVKEYVELHQGTVEVRSIPCKETVFTISLPGNLKPVATSETMILTGKSPDVLKEADSAQYRILLVEDNDELRHYLASELNRYYTVLEACDGMEGLERAQKELPDLLVSDVMMPRMNGMELCQKLKNNVKISHIPVILLTARASDEHRISGYQAGADEYLTKPFNMDVLMLRISKLIADQHFRQKQFSEKVEVNPRDITITSIDELLIQKTLDYIEKNMDNADYSVQQLSNDLNMDRTVLYKKLQSITGLAPLEFIRSIRLKRAAQLLLQGNLPVTEVSEKVGFNTQKYFTKYFKEAFGVTPSQYAQQQKPKVG